MARKRQLRILAECCVVALLGGLVLLGACNSPGGGGTAPADGGDETPAIVAGESIEVATQTVPTSGGTITVNRPGDPLDGIMIEVLDGTYSSPTTFAISYQPILEHSLPDGFEPVSPLIEIDNGGELADEPMGVTFPADLPEGYFGMAFFYNKETGALEGIPPLGQDSTTLTVMTRHFSPVLVTRIPIDKLNGVQKDTGFVPGVDTWQIKNWGSFISGGGNCSGMSLSAMWYYVHGKKINGEPLHGKYDAWALGTELKTPDFDLDDDSAIKLCSVVQKDLKADHHFDNLLNRYTWGTEVMEGDSLAFYSIAASLKAYDKEPVYLSVVSTADDRAHALVCYRIDNYTLYVVDPNDPANRDRRIVYTPGPTLAEGRLGPYKSAQSIWEILLNRQTTYDKIYFRGRTSIHNMVEIGKLWSDMESGTIGRGDGHFPDYRFLVVERDDSNNVTQTYELDPLNEFQSERQNIEIALDAPFEGRFHLYTFQSLPNAVAHSSKKDSLVSLIVDLQPGENLIGLHVEGMATWEDTYNEDGQIKTRNETGWRWAGFDWLKMTYEEEGHCTIYIPADPPGIGAGSWIIRGYDDAQCAGEMTGDTVWEFYSDGTIKEHWADEPFDNYTWEVTDSTITITIEEPSVGYTTIYEGTVSDDCCSIECGTGNTYGADWEIAETYWTGERRY
jgi:hypothetical protein